MAQEDEGLDTVGVLDDVRNIGVVQVDVSFIKGLENLRSCNVLRIVIVRLR